MTRAQPGEDASAEGERFIPPPSEDAASYIADLTSELARLARGSRLEFLAHLLDIAQLEAARASRKPSRQG